MGAVETSPVVAQSALKRVVVVGPSGRSLDHLCGPLIADAIARGHSVHALTPDFDERDVMSLSGLGVSIARVKLKPDKFKLRPGSAVLKMLAAQLSDIAPHVVFAHGAEIMPLAIKAAVRARVARIVVSVSNLHDGKISTPLRRALGRAHVIVTNTREDHRAVTAAGLLCKGRILLQLPGTGADLAALDKLALPPLTPSIVFAFAARLDVAKGALEFCEAARLLRAEGANAQFILAGDDSTGPDAVRQDALARFDHDVTRVKDFNGLLLVLSQAHVFVAPSHQGGMPYGVLQALASGRPCIVTDVPGYRETVDEMVNGMIVPPRDVSALVDAFRRFVQRPELIALMGRAGRLKAERHFSQAAVNAALLTALDLQ